MVNNHLAPVFEIVVNISSDRVVLSGFTVQNYGNNSFYTDLIFIHSDNNIVSGNIITGRDNVITDGITIDIGINNNISGNIIRECHSGIDLVWYSNNNSIIGNTLSNNTFCISTAEFSINDIIFLNNMSNSTFGIIALNCFNYEITNNNFTLTFLQTERVYGKLTPNKLKVAIWDIEKEEKISQEKLLIADKTSERAEERTIKIPLTLKSGNYDKNKNYYLLMIDNETGIERLRIPFQINITISNIFEDF